MKFVDDIGGKSKSVTLLLVLVAYCPLCSPLVVANSARICPAGISQWKDRQHKIDPETDVEPEFGIVFLDIAVIAFAQFPSTTGVLAALIRMSVDVANKCNVWPALLNEPGFEAKIIFIVFHFARPSHGLSVGQNVLYSTEGRVIVRVRKASPK